MKKLLPLLFLAGCATDNEMLNAYKAQAYAVESQSFTMPVLAIKCGEKDDACKGLSLVYNPRRDIVIPEVTNTNDVLKEAVQPIADVLTTGSIVLGVARTMKYQAENGGQGNTNVRNTNINTSSDNNSLSGSNGIGTSDPLVVESSRITESTKETIHEK